MSAKIMTSLQNISDVVIEQTAGLDCHLFQLSLYVIAMLFIGLTGLAGNFISIFILDRERRTLPVTTLLLQSLAAADNFFLIVWMMHYAIRHVIIRLGLGNELAWIYFRVYTFPFLYIGQTLTIWMMMIIAVNRFLLVRSSPTIDVVPDSSSTTRLTIYRCVVASVVILSVIYNLPRFFEIEVVASGGSRSANSTSELATGNWNRTWFGRHPTYKSVYVDTMYYIFTFALPLIILLSVNVYIVVVYRAAQKRHNHGLRLQSQGHGQNYSDHATLEDLSVTASTQRNLPIAVTANLSTNAVTSFASYAVRGCCGCRCDLESRDQVDGDRTREQTDWQTMANEQRGGQPPQLLHREMIVVTSGDGCIPTSGSGGAIVCDLWKSAPECGSGDCCSCCNWLPRLTSAVASDECPDGDLIGDQNLPGTANNEFSRQTAAAVSPTRSHRYAHGSSVTAKGTRRIQTAHTAEHDVTVVMVTVIVIFLVCLTPARVVQIIVDYGHKDNQDCGKVPFYLIHFSNVLELLNSSVNFIVYCALYQHFRRLFVESLLSTFPSLNRFKFCRSIATGSRTFVPGGNCRMHGNRTKRQETDIDCLAGQGRGQGHSSRGRGGGALLAGCRCPGRRHRPVDCTLAVTTEALELREICVSESLIETTVDCRGGHGDRRLKETVSDVTVSSSKTGNSTESPENVQDT